MCIVMKYFVNIFHVETIVETSCYQTASMNSYSSVIPFTCVSTFDE